VSLLVERITFRTGEASIGVTLPIAWARHVGLKPGDKVEIVIDDVLVIRAKRVSRERDKMSIRK
jgi:antitoxin component of MazEF toxin-antitoxin module